MVPSLGFSPMKHLKSQQNVNFFVLCVNLEPGLEAGEGEPLDYGFILTFLFGIPDGFCFNVIYKMANKTEQKLYFRHISENVSFQK